MGGIFKTIALKLYMVWVLLVFTSFLLIFFPFIIIPVLLGERFGSISYFVLRLWSLIFSVLTFIPYEIRGKENIDRKASYIFTSNHTSFLDAPGIAMSIPMQFRPLGKKELLKIPVFGIVVKNVCVIVDRSSSESRKQSIKEMKKLLRKAISILIFPEGTQNRTGEILNPFYNGAFRIALDTEQPILPMVAIGAGRLLPPGSLNIRPGKVIMAIGKPIPASEYQDLTIEELREKVFGIMKKLIEDNQK